MDSIITKATLVNWALVELGLPANFSIDDESELGGTVDSLWQRAIDKAFALHDWTFCRKTFLLTRRVETPVTGYAYGFDLPGSTLGAPLKIARDPRCTAPLREFYLEGQELHANEPVVYGRWRVMVDPEAWDPAFRSAFIPWLASLLAVPLTQDTDTADRLYARAFGSPSQGGAGGEFGRLLAQDRASSPLGSGFPDYSDPLLAARL